MKKGFFISATGTDVGKTIVTALLFKHLHKSGYNVVPVKPVQTGCFVEKGELLAPDLETIQKIWGSNFSNEKKRLLSPYKLKSECSPHLAANIEGTTLTVKEIYSKCLDVYKHYEYALFEGAGGIMVPLNKKELILDLIKKINLPLILVVPTTLGSINYSLLTIQALRGANVKIGGIIFNNCQKPKKENEYISQDNESIIEHLSGVKILGRIPYIENVEDSTKLNGLTKDLEVNFDKLMERYN